MQNTAEDLQWIAKPHRGKQSDVTSEEGQEHHKFFFVFVCSRSNKILLDLRRILRPEQKASTTRLSAGVPVLYTNRTFFIHRRTVKLCFVSSIPYTTLLSPRLLDRMELPIDWLYGQETEEEERAAK